MVLIQYLQFNVTDNLIVIIYIYAYNNYGINQRSNQIVVNVKIN